MKLSVAVTINDKTYDELILSKFSLVSTDAQRYLVSAELNRGRILPNNDKEILIGGGVKYDCRNFSQLIEKDPELKEILDLLLLKLKKITNL